MNEAILRHLARTEAMLTLLINTSSALLSQLENKDVKIVRAKYEDEIIKEQDRIYKELKANLK